MTTQFRDRTEAGRLLAEKLQHYAGQRDVLVLALPRGGVPVAAEVALKLQAPLDVFLVRKLGLPGNVELAMGAIASGGVRVINTEVVETLGIPDSIIDAVAAHEQRELDRRERAYRGGRPPPDVKGRTVILIDDGIATGSTMMAAIQALRGLHAGRIVAGTPVVSPTTFREIQAMVEEIIAVMVPVSFQGVGQWYRDFSQTTDEDVCKILAEAGAKLQSADA